MDQVERAGNAGNTEPGTVESGTHWRELGVFHIGSQSRSADGG
jgi:hypothetical protein